MGRVTRNKGRGVLTIPLFLLFLQLTTLTQASSQLELDCRHFTRHTPSLDSPNLFLKETMTATSEQIALHQDKDLKDIIASIAAYSNSGTTVSEKKRSNSTSSTVSRTSEMHSPARSIKSERRPSFSITLPSSSSRASFSLLQKPLFMTEDDRDSNTTASASAAIATAAGHRARRPSVHFIPDEDDSLLNHEAKLGLPKTPYPTTGEEEARIQSSLFSRH